MKLEYCKSYALLYDRYDGCSPRNCWGNHSSANDTSVMNRKRQLNETYDNIADVLHVCTSNKASRRNRQQTMKGTHGENTTERTWKENTRHGQKTQHCHGHRAQALDSNIRPSQAAPSATQLEAPYARALDRQVLYAPTPDLTTSELRSLDSAARIHNRYHFTIRRARFTVRVRSDHLRSATERKQRRSGG